MEVSLDRIRDNRFPGRAPRPTPEEGTPGNEPPNDEPEVAMGRILPRILLLSATVLFFSWTRTEAGGNIPIMVDGLPLDARAIAVGDEAYVPAWILENYAHTKIKWMRRSNLLEILTVPTEAPIPATEGSLKIRIGFYLTSEGFVIGRNTRLFLLNADPKEFRFPDGKTPADRANEGALERMGGASGALRDYLGLPPTERFTPKGWGIVARMPKEEIASLAITVDRYELLYKSLFYDLITNLVLSKERQLKDPSVIDESLKGLRIDSIDVAEDGSAKVRLPDGLYFLYARMLHRNRQVVWDLPVTVRGGETQLELSNRNAAILQ